MTKTLRVLLFLCLLASHAGSSVLQDPPTSGASKCPPENPALLGGIASHGSSKATANPHDQKHHDISSPESRPKSLSSSFDNAASPNFSALQQQPSDASIKGDDEIVEIFAAMPPLPVLKQHGVYGLDSAPVDLLPAFDDSFLEYPDEPQGMDKSDTEFDDAGVDNDRIAIAANPLAQDTDSQSPTSAILHGNDTADDGLLPPGSSQPVASETVLDEHAVEGRQQRSQSTPSAISQSNDTAGGDPRPKGPDRAVLSRATLDRRAIVDHEQTLLTRFPGNDAFSTLRVTEPWFLSMRYNTVNTVATLTCPDDQRGLLSISACCRSYKDHQMTLFGVRAQFGIRSTCSTVAIAPGLNQCRNKQGVGIWGLQALRTIEKFRNFQHITDGLIAGTLRLVNSVETKGLMLAFKDGHLCIAKTENCPFQLYWTNGERVEAVSPDAQNKLAISRSPSDPYGIFIIAPYFLDVLAHTGTILSLAGDTRDIVRFLAEEESKLDVPPVDIVVARLW